MTIRLAVDIGGTFTDLAAYDPDDGRLWFTKSSTTPSDLTDAVMACIEKAGIALSDVELFVHGTTLGINTIIERKGPITALITTKGFRDVYEMGRRNRPDIWDLLFHRSRPLVLRRHRYEVSERLAATGAVLTPLDEQQVASVAREILAEGIATVAVCLLHSYANPEHEKRIGTLLQREHPDAAVSISSDINREYREYERTSTTVINAYLRPVVGKYLDRLSRRLQHGSASVSTLIMQSSGGVMPLPAAAQQPVRIIESGPAGGVAGALWMCSMLGISDAIAFDMGGTTAKACLIEDGRAKVTTDYWIGGRVEGHPAQVPFLDIIEIGAGGGSIASVDAVGALRVGPESAGAVPGPACYGLGGTLATVTDANLLVGKLDPGRFLGGQMPLDRGRSAEAFAPLVERLGLNMERTANGVVQIANTMMAEAVSKVTVERGHDPRDFVLIAYGGAGPMHAAAVARELGIRRLVIPQAPSQFSALGMLTTDLRYDFAQTHPEPLTQLDEPKLEARFRELEEMARAQIAANTDAHDLGFVRSVDMRYLGQMHTLSVALPEVSRDVALLEVLAEHFHGAHEARYGHNAPGEPTEVISYRLAAFVHLSKPSFPAVARGADRPPAAARAGSREVLWEDGTTARSEIFLRERLLAGNTVYGPAVIHEETSVTPIGPGARARVDDFGNLEIDL